MAGLCGRLFSALVTCSGGGCGEEKVNAGFKKFKFPREDEEG